MAEIIREISVDVAKDNVFQAIVAKQFDSNSRFLKVTITNNGEPMNIAPSSSVTINAQRDDREAEAFLGSVNDDGTITVPLTNWMLQLDGIVKCDISIVSGESRLTTTMFSLAVEEAAYGGSDISDDPNYDLLVQLLDECAVAKSACVDATTSANKAASNANSKATLADTNAKLAAKKAALAEEKAGLADTATENANTATANANTATDNAQTATANAEAAATAANEAADRIEAIAPYSKEQSDRRYAKAITCTASGTTAKCTDVAIGSGLRKAEITADYTERDSSFSASKVAEKIIEVDNTAYLGMIDNCPCVVCKAETMQNPDVFGFRGAFKPNTQYTLTIKAKSIDGTAFNLQLFTHYTDGTQDINPCNLTGDMQTFTIQTTAAKSVLYMEFEAKAVKDIAIDTDVFNLTAADGSGLLPSPYNYMPLPPPDMPTKITISGSSGNVDYPLPEGIELNALPQVQDSFDAISGKLTKRVGKVVLDGVTKAAGGQYVDTIGKAYPSFIFDDFIGKKTGTNFVCTHDKQVTYNLSGNGPLGFYANTTDSLYKYFYWAVDYSLIGTTAATPAAENVTAMNNYIKAQHAAGTPVTLLYELKTPETVQYTPIDIPVADSTITVTADTGGNIQIEYVEDSNLIKDYAASAKEDSAAAAKSEDNAKKYSDIATASSTAAEQALANVQEIENRVTKMTYEEYEAAVKNPNNYYIVYTPEVTA